jgi:hypothetical protein
VDSNVGNLGSRVYAKSKSIDGTKSCLGSTYHSDIEFVWCLDTIQVVYYLRVDPTSKPNHGNLSITYWRPVLAKVILDP